jgi:DNA-binding FadR family transcriptional regulator
LGIVTESVKRMSSGPQFERVKPVRLYQHIVEQIEDAIARGELKPGARLPSERELVAQFGASRPTVREALRVLESSGVVQSRPGDPNGPEILPFSSQALQKQMTRLLRTQGISMSELIMFRMIMDSSGSMVAAQLRTEDELEGLQQCIARMEIAIDKGYNAFSEADMSFHDAIARASRNSIIAVCNDIVREVILSLISDKVANASNSKALMQQNLEHHREVLKAIAAGDGPEASRLSCCGLYDYYHSYVPADDRPLLLAMLPAADRTTRE